MLRIYHNMRPSWHYDRVNIEIPKWYGVTHCHLCAAARLVWLIKKKNDQILVMEPKILNGINSFLCILDSF
jgi:hypothetical protein